MSRRPSPHQARILQALADGNRLEESEVFIGEPPEPGGGYFDMWVPHPGRVIPEHVRPRARMLEILIGNGWIAVDLHDSQIVSFRDHPDRCARHWWSITDAGLRALLMVIEPSERGRRR